jgi:hypothetical protein
MYYAVGSAEQRGSRLRFPLRMYPDLYPGPVTLSMEFPSSKCYAYAMLLRVSGTATAQHPNQFATRRIAMTVRKES